MTFKSKEELKQFIIRHHLLIAGVSAQDATGWIIDDAEEVLQKNPAVTGITYEAMQDAEGYGKLVTLITIGKTVDGWTYVESVKWKP